MYDMVLGIPTWRVSLACGQIAGVVTATISAKITEIGGNCGKLFKKN